MAATSTQRSSTLNCAILAILSALSFSNNALAAAEVNGPSAPRQIEEVIVSATKRDATLRDIPTSIAVLNGTAIEDAGASQLSDFLEQVPGISLNPVNADQNRLSIRGVAADTANLLTSQTAATLIGDTAFSDPFITAVSPDLNPFDLSTIEILKGPQGTLFGGSALSGAIRYVPNKPEMEAASAKAFYQHSEVKDGDSAWLSGLAINAPLIPELAIRLAGTERHSGGVIDDQRRELEDVDAIDQSSHRAALRWLPSDAWDINLFYLSQSTEQQDLLSADNLDGRRTRNTTAGPSAQETDFDISSIDLRYNNDWGSWVSLTSRINKYANQDLDGTRAVFDGADNAVRLLVEQDVSGLAQEFRWVSNDDGSHALHWVVGAFFLDYEQTLFNGVRSSDLGNIVGLSLNLPPALGGIVGGIIPPAALDLAVINADIELQEKAVFGDLGWRISDQLELSLGLRWFDTETSGVLVSSGALILASTGSPEIENDASISEEGINPKMSIRYEFSDRLSVHAYIAKGFRFGGIQGLSDTPTTDINEVYESDELWNYEIGLRSAFFDNTLTVDATVFKIDWDKPQISQKTTDGLFNVIDNVGAAEIDGAELSSQWHTPLDGLSLTGTLAYTDSRTSEPFQSQTGEDVPVGSYMPNTPLWQSFLSIKYRRSIGDVQFGSHLSHAYVSEAKSDLNRSFDTMGYDTLEAGISIFAPSWLGAPRLSAVLSNIEDSKGINNVLLSSNTTQDVYYIRPRTLSVRLGLEF